MLPAGLVQAQIWISTVGSVLELLLILRILQLGLSRQYRAFFVFLACDLGRDLSLRALEGDLSSHTYAVAWALSAPLLWIALCFAIVEICERFYQIVPASREVKRTIVAAALLASIVISLAVSAELIDNVSPLVSWQEAIRVTNRFVFMAGAVVLWTQRIFFLRDWPVLPHNVRVHRSAFTLYLSADATLRFLSGLSNPVLAMRANVICSTLFCVSLLIWLVGFRLPLQREPHANSESQEAEPTHRRG